MKRILRTLAALFLASLSVFAAECVPARAAQIYAKDMLDRAWKEPGGHRWIKFGNDSGGDIVWRVLKVYTYAGGGEISGADAKIGDKIAVLLAENAVGAKRPFNNVNGKGKGNWIDSEIKKWLNGASFDVFSAAEKSSVVTSIYKLGGSNVLSGYGKDTTDSSKIFLPSVEEAGDDAQKIASDYFADDRDRDLDKSSTQDMWWLRSPGIPYNNTEKAMFIGAGGALSNNGHGLTHSNYVRPAMSVNLSSPTFPADRDVFYGVTVAVKVNGAPLSGAAAALSDGKNPDITQYTDDKGETEFMTPAGDYSLTVSAPGCLTYKEHIIVTPSALSFDVSLTPDSTALNREIKFGNYNTKDIEWIVLEADQNSDRALLLSKNALIAEKFNDAADSTWKNSKAQKYLNSDSGGFLNGGSFTTPEISAVKSTFFQDTQTSDRVFLLSAKDALMYMPDNASRQEAAKQHAWWLRTNDGKKQLLLIRKDGRLAQAIASSDVVYGENIMIRPAMWVSLKYLYNGGDKTSPTPGGIFEAVGNVTGTSWKLQWERAADNLSATKDLRYYVYRSIADDVSTALDCEAGGRQALNASGTLDMSSFVVSGLSPDTVYFFNIVVEDEYANKSAYKRISVTTTDKSALLSLINNAKNTEQQSTVGTGAGQYPQSAKDALLAAIADAERVYNDSNATKQDVSDALNALNTAVTTFGNEQISSGGSGGGSGSNTGGGSGSGGSGGGGGSGGTGGGGGSGGSGGGGGGSGGGGGNTGGGGSGGSGGNTGGGGSGNGSSVKDDLADKINSASQKLADAKSNGQVGDGLGQYSQAEWDALNSAVQDARAELNKPGITDIEMQKALDRLDAAVARFENSKNSAIDVLGNKIKGAFQKVKDAESSGQVGDGPGQYPRPEWEALNKAIEDARKVSGDPNSTDLEIKEALDRLNAAVEAFENSRNAVKIGGGGGCDAGSSGILFMSLIVFCAWRMGRKVKYK